MSTLHGSWFPDSDPVVEVPNRRDRYPVMVGFDTLAVHLNVAQLRALHEQTEAALCRIASVSAAAPAGERWRFTDGHEPEGAA